MGVLEGSRTAVRTPLRSTVADFADLRIAHDERVLEPRAWTVAQSRWAADLARSVPDGPVLELCCGAGQIGLLAARLSGRRLVGVDASPVAVRYARLNAERAGLGHRVEIRQGDLASTVGPEERFAVALADPPWVRRDDLERFPADPTLAIDGGPEGLDVARQCVAVLGRHVLPGGAVLLQLGNPGQAEALAPTASAVGLATVELREYGDRGVLVLLRPDGRDR